MTHLDQWNKISLISKIKNNSTTLNLLKMPKKIKESKSFKKCSSKPLKIFKILLTKGKNNENIFYLINQFSNIPDFNLLYE